jgi:hypothetical protein
VKDKLERIRKSGSGLILRQYPGIWLEGLRKRRKISVRIAGLCAENSTQDLQNN